MTHKQLAECYKRAGLVPPPDIADPDASKYNARKKSVGGILFASSLEATCYQILSSWQAAGAIDKLELQPKFVLQPGFRRKPDRNWIRAITYKADFRFEQLNPMTGNTEIWIIESKGFRTEPYILRRKMFLAKFPDLIFAEWDAETVKSLVSR